MISFKVTTPTANLKQYKRALTEDLKNGGHGPVGRAIDDWGRMYLEYLYYRFETGGADKPWTPLARSTVQKKGHARILIDSGVLQEAFNPSGNSAQVKRRVRDGIVIGIRGGSHPTANSVEQLAQIHQSGRGKLPRRPVFVPIAMALQRRITQRLVNAFNELSKQNGLS